MFKKPEVDSVIEIARKAGDIIMSYRGKVEPEFKGDLSPVTKADKEASATIIKGLSEYTPDIPIVSEEEPAENNKAIVRTCETYWVTDPLDGTKTYIDGYDGFGVHIALIHRGEPILGVVYFPAQGSNEEGKIYFTGNDGHAYVEITGQKPKKMKAPNKIASKEKIKAAMGWRKDQDVCYLGEYKVDKVGAVGGARLCVTAEGEAEAAIMNMHFNYWDVAAGHAILKAAGGDLINPANGEPLRYDNESLIVEPALGASKNVLKTLVGQKQGFSFKNFFKPKRKQESPRKP